MASSFGIQTGELSSVKNYTDDTMVQKTLLEFAAAMGINVEGMSNQEKLDGVVDHLENYIVHRVRMHRRAVVEEQARAQINSEYNLE